MIKNTFFFLFLIGFSASIKGQLSVPDSLEGLFYNQLSVFPQEKIYLHTDKPYYITGEKIWFRAHLADAVTHVPAPFSRYIYVELLNPLDSLITRIKIRNDKDAYYGHIDIPEDIGEGDYTIRAYTYYMLNLEERYFCTKSIRIGNPDNRQLRVDAQFSFDTDGKTNMKFRFFNSINEKPVVPKIAQVRISDGKPQRLKVGEDGTASFSFTSPVGSRQSVLLVEVNDPEYSFRQFIPVPAPDNDFDVTFYPEGGPLLMGGLRRVAFKALMSDGRPANVQGAVFDQHGNKYDSIRTSYNGMGYFMVYPEEGVSYQVVCTNDRQQTKRIELPEALKTGYALSVVTQKNNLFVTLSKSVPEERRDTLYLLAHTRGIVHLSMQWEEDRKILSLSQKDFPSGVLHLVLFDARLNPVSERLVFINNDDQAQVSYTSEKETFTSRSLVNNRVQLTDEDGQPLSGSFSVAITADHAVTVDTTVNILTQLLLTSDLHGRIDNPAAYFRKDNVSSGALDMLMMTQGWRRYDVAALAQGRPTRPTVPIEFGSVISGRVKRILIDRPIAKSRVTIVSPEEEYFDLTETDSAGCFIFNLRELPDSTVYIVSAVGESGNRNVELLVDDISFPKKTLPMFFPIEINQQSLAGYIEKAFQHSRNEVDVWTLLLSEVSVVATYKKPPRQSAFYSLPSSSIVIDELPFTPSRVSDALRFVGARITSNDITIRDVTPLLVINDIPYNTGDMSIVDFLESVVTMSEIEQIDILKDPSNTAVFNAEAVIMIYTKKGEVFYGSRPRNNILTHIPLGYQQPVEFYAPKYDTPEKRDAQKIDLRTTIHWQPVTQTDSMGVASFEFYTADTRTSYTIIIEGLADNGKVIRQEMKLWKPDE